MSQPDLAEPTLETPEINQPDWAAPDGESAEPAMAEQVSEAARPSAPAARERSFFLPALFLLLVGGLLGWVLRGQSTAQPSAPISALSVAVAPTTVTLAGDSGELVADPIPTAPSTVTLSDNRPFTAALSRVPVGPTPVSIVTETLRVLGNPNAPVTVVEFSDYQCPFCLRYFQQTFPQFKQEYIDSGRVYYVFKDYPITGLHPVAPRVHEAGRCVGELGGSKLYWQAHDSFFNNQAQWADKPQPELDNILIGLTADVGAAGEQMRACLESGRYAEAVKTDMAEGERLGVGGTPTFFINGYPIVGAQPYDLFQQAIGLAEQGRLGEAYARSTEAEAAQAQPAAAPQPVAVPLGDAPGKGKPDAPVTIVEYSDFQCPFCRRHFTETQPQLQTYIDAGQVYYLFKDFPLAIHPQAPKAHESTRCARELGGDEAFWQMHDLLFTNQPQWASNPDHVNVFKALATQAGLPQAKFDECLDSGRYAAAVNADLAEGQQLGIRGTPTFFVNGRQLTGALPFSAFQQVIDGLLGK